MKAPYTAISILYNPASTGASKKNARALERDLADTPVGAIVAVIPTKRAGHAEKLAYELAKASKRPLIISSSGDGGYNEVVNGALHAQDEGRSPVCGLLPSGNANDHYTNLHSVPIKPLILHGKESRIDVLALEMTSPSGKWQRYAHSYIGFGLTAKVGSALNQTDLNAFNQLWIVLRGFTQLRATRLRVNGRVRKYDSLIFSNVAKMSKVLSLSKEASLTDGKFEVSAFYTHNKLRLLRLLLKASTIGLEETSQAREYSLETLKPLTVQLDGEVFPLKGNATVQITVRPKALHCIV